jgi:hypothetical protein
MQLRMYGEYVCSKIVPISFIGNCVILYEQTMNYNGHCIVYAVIQFHNLQISTKRKNSMESSKL